MFPDLLQEIVGFSMLQSAQNEAAALGLHSARKVRGLESMPRNSNSGL